MKTKREIKYYITKIIQQLFGYFSLKQDNQFFVFFVDIAQNVSKACDVLVDLIGNNCYQHDNQINNQIKSYHQRVAELHSSVLATLNICFITPIDRGDIQGLSVLCLKLSKKIVRISYKIKIYSINCDNNNSLVSGLVLLQNMAKMAVEMISVLQEGKYSKISYSDDYLHYFDENELDDFRYAIKNIYNHNSADLLNILRVREVYMALESAIETNRNILELIMQIAVKAV